MSSLDEAPRGRKAPSKAVYVGIKSHQTNRASVRRVGNYIGRKAEAIVNDEGKTMNANEISKYTAQWPATDGRQSAHIVLSLPPHVNAKPQDVLACAEATIGQRFPDRQYVLALHTDRNPHVHVLLAARSQTLEPLRIGRQEIKAIRSQMVSVARAKGYDVDAGAKPGKGRSINTHALKEPSKAASVVERLAKEGKDYRAPLRVLVRTLTPEAMREYKERLMACAAALYRRDKAHGDLLSKAVIQAHRPNREATSGLRSERQASQTVTNAKEVIKRQESNKTQVQDRSL